VRAVLDPNVIISGLLSPSGAPAELLRALDGGALELIASEMLLEELARALTYPKLRAHIGDQDTTAIVRWVSETATVMSSPLTTPPVRSADPGDDCLIALAYAHRVALVSGDKHLLNMAGEIPVFSPREFLERLTNA
jgi:uncharacterized protein